MPRPLISIVRRIATPPILDITADIGEVATKIGCSRQAVQARVPRHLKPAEWKQRSCDAMPKECWRSGCQKDAPDSPTRQQ